MGNAQPKISKIHSSNNAFICEICTEQVPMHQKLKNEQTKSKQKNKKRSIFSSVSSSQPCAHPFCTDCIAKYIQVKIGENEKPDIKCPDTNCANLLDPLSCRSFLPTDVFVRWCYYLCKSTVCERYDTAYCPNPNCSELVINECKQSLGSHLFWKRCLKGNKQMVSECPHCKLLFCLRCMGLCLADHQCSTSRRVKRESKVLLMKMAANNKWKRCPSCRFYVERKDGCAHITCRCGSHFCYSCGTKRKMGHKHICKTLNATIRL